MLILAIGCMSAALRGKDPGYFVLATWCGAQTWLRSYFKTFDDLMCFKYK